MNPFASSTNKEKKKQKNFMMMRYSQNVRSKNKRSFREKQVSFPCDVGSTWKDAVSCTGARLGFLVSVCGHACTHMHFKVNGSTLSVCVPELCVCVSPLSSRVQARSSLSEGVQARLSLRPLPSLDFSDICPIK